jgi:hypothetical protein
MKTLTFFIFVVLSSICLVANSQTAPLFYYPFNGNTNDESGNGNTCTNNGATLTNDRFGNANSAYYFDGQTNFMEIIPVSKIDSLQDFTLSVWYAQQSWEYSSAVAPSDQTLIGQQYIISGHSASPNNYNVNEGIGVALLLKSDSTSYILPYYHWDIVNPAANRVVQQIKYPTYDTKWTHVVWMRKNGQDYSYINGQLIINPQYYSNNPSGDYINEQHPLYIGSFNSLFSKNYQFNGKIDDIRIYDRAISDCEVSALYNESNYAQSGPLFYYPFNGNTNDESGNGNTCTNYGASLTTDRFGNANSAYSFNGQSNFMEINPVSKVDSLQDFTLSVWYAQKGWQYSSAVAPSDTTIIGQQYIIGGHSSSPNDYNVTEGLGVCLMLKSDSTSSILPYYHWDSYNNTISGYRLVQQIKYQTYDSSWTHLVWMRKNGQDYSYINGQLIVNPQYYSYSPSSNPIDQQHPLYIGSFNSLFDKNYQFYGKIDDIRIYNRAISDCEVTALFTEGTIPLKSLSITVKSILNELQGNDGSINITVSGGKQPYTYLWSNNSTNENLTAIPGGNYTVTITDALKNSLSMTYTVYSKLSISGALTTNEVNGFDGSINISVEGGKAPYSYLWSTNVITQDLSNISGGSYTVTITDALGNTLINNYTIYSKLSISAITTNEKDSADGSINITVSGGKSPYSYLWNTNSKTEDLTGIVGGNYSVTVTDAENNTIIALYTIAPKIFELYISGSVVSDKGVFNDGIVVLYKGNNGYLNACTYKELTTSGTFVFDSLDKGIYFLQAIPNHGMSSKYISCYFNKENKWENANSIDLTGQAFGVTLTVDDVKDFTFNGNCSIKGNVYSDDSIYSNLFKSPLKSSTNSSQNIIINLMQNGKIIASTLTDDLGEYSFSNIPTGSYQISIEHAGYITSPTNVIVNSTDVSINSIDFTLVKATVKSNTIVNPNTISLYPNPAHLFVTFSTICDNIQICSLQGIVLIEQKNVSTINISDLKPGMYFVRLISSNSIISKSFIKE